jgi:serine/tyrosine/threonine adenylyltransferase
VANPELILLNHALAIDLHLDVEKLSTPEGAAMFAGNWIPPGAEPLAQAYAGHQFGYPNPQLGDGRAILLGEVFDSFGNRRDIQLKGSGPTAYSRNGDGRAALGPVIREYLMGEAMFNLGVKTTRALAFVTSGEHVFRGQMLPGAILTRVASSHVRIGTFEYFRMRRNFAALAELVEFVIQRHYPQLAQTNDRVLALLSEVAQAQAQLVASWMHLGFIHGVMNTDNMTVSGETLDYGPCAFMDAYDPATVFSSIDETGRYAYGNQASIAQWNLTQLAECLLPLMEKGGVNALKHVEEILTGFREQFSRHWMAGMRKKLGLDLVSLDDDKLVLDLLTLMEKYRADFTLTFRYLGDKVLNQDSVQDFLSLFTSASGDLTNWLERWQARLLLENKPASVIAQAMNRVNPLYIPRNYWVEEVIRAGVSERNFQPLKEFLSVLSTPFENQPGKEKYAQVPPPWASPYHTFCGT